MASSDAGRHEESIGILKDVSSLAEKTKNKVLMGSAYFNLRNALEK